MTKYNFGNGPVPAHRHVNLNGSLGGWVAETAMVDPSVDVGPSAVVYDQAVIKCGSHLHNKARIHGLSVLQRTAVHDFATVSGSLISNSLIGGRAKIVDSRIDRAYIDGNSSIFATTLTESEVYDATVCSKHGDITLRKMKLRGERIKITNAKQVLTLSPVGSEHGILNVTFQKRQVYINRGCFWGTLREFERRVRETHRKNIHVLAEYTEIIALIRKLHTIKLKEGLL